MRQVRRVPVPVHPRPVPKQHQLCITVEIMVATAVQGLGMGMRGTLHELLVISYLIVLPDHAPPCVLLVNET